MKSPHILVIAASLLLAVTAQAQRKSAGAVVPPNLRPPAGMCRIWLDGVPASRQPAPTDCASALRNRPAKGQVIFGDDYAHPDSERRADDTRDGAQALKGVAPLPKSLDPKPSTDSTAGGRKPADAGRKKGDSSRKTGAHKPDSTASGGSSGAMNPAG